MPLYSILLASRGRTQYLRETIKSIETTAHNYEIILMIDDDDEETLKVAQELTKPNIFVHVRPRGNNFVEQYLNWGFQFARATYILLLGDDVLFKTKDWDINAYARLEEYLKDKPDGIVLGITDDGILKHKIQGKEWGIISSCSFPIISRKGIEALGFVLDPSFYDESSDFSIVLTYSKVNRTIDLRDIVTTIHMPVEFTKKYGTIYHDKTYKGPYKEVSTIMKNGKTEENAIINADKLRKFL